MRNASVDLRPYQRYAEPRRRFLSELGCPDSCRDPLAEFSEWLVAQQLNGTMAASRVQRGYDLIRPNGRRVQVKYLANPSSKWVNEHHVRFTDDMDEYALVVFEALNLLAVVIFQRETIGKVCALLQKRHPNQDSGLQFTRRNFQTIISEPKPFQAVGVEIHDP